MNSAYTELSKEELDNILAGELNENHNQLTVLLLRDLIQTATEEEKLNAGFIAQSFNILKEELNNPSPSIYSDEKAEELNQAFGLDIDDTRTINTKLKFGDKLRIQELEIFKSPEELLNEYSTVVNEFKKNHPEEYKKNAMLVAKLYDGAIKNYKERMSKQHDEHKSVELMERITKLYDLKSMLPQYETDIAKLLANLAFVSELYNREQDNDYIFDVLSKSDKAIFEFLTNHPEIRATTDVNRLHNSIINNPKEKETIDDKKAKEKTPIDLSSTEVITDYSQEKINLTEQSISKKIFNIASATGEKISANDPVLVSAFNESLAKLEKELDSFGRKKVKLYKQKYGNNWKATYIEAYTRGWNAGTEANINRAYNAGIKFREHEINKAEESFSFEQILTTDSLEQISVFAQSSETNSIEEQTLQNAFINLSESRKAKNLPEFKRSQQTIDDTANKALSHGQSLDTDQLNDYVSKLSPLVQTAVYINALSTSKDQLKKESVAKYIDEITVTVQEKESRSK